MNIVIHYLSIHIREHFRVSRAPQDAPKHKDKGLPLGVWGGVYILALDAPMLPIG
ncbi:hypothetical protein HMPREF1989_00534 [Porphyromonas gingivalis F0566]|nr:hypothetical protein HMPREF1989_00534 [Porphyromonas gingivalis F0566]